MERMNWKKSDFGASGYVAVDGDVVWTVVKEDDGRWYVSRRTLGGHTIYGYPHKTLKAAKEHVENLRG